MKPLIIAALTFLLYSNTFQGPFVFDDVPNIKENIYVHITRLSFSSLYRAAFFGPCQNRPVPKISFAINYFIHKLQVFGYHLINVLIHAVTAILLYLFIRQTLIAAKAADSDDTASWMAFFSAGLWAVHPIHTQAVSYIVQRMTCMAAMFYLVSLICYVKARLQPSSSKRRILFGVSILSGVFAIGSKEIAATLPFFMVLYDLYFIQKWKRINQKVFFGILAGLMIYSVVIIRIYLNAEPVDAILSGYETREFTMSQRLLTQFRVVILYISLMLIPHPDRLNLEHDIAISYSLMNPIDTVVSLAAVCLLIIAAIVSAKNYSLFSFSILWFLGQLVIESSVVGLELMFEHRLYLPSMLTTVILVVSGYRWVQTRLIRLELLLMVMVVLSIWTYSRNFVWADDLALWQDAVEKSPNKDRPHVSLGVSLAKRGRFEEAIAQYRAALRINPKNLYAQHNLGSLLETEAAIDQYSEAIRINPNSAEAHNNIGVAYVAKGDYRLAKTHLVTALKLNPMYKAPYNNLGNILMAERKIDEAEVLYRYVLEIDPEDAIAYNNLGIVFMKKEKYQEAIEYFSEALRLKPDYPEAEKNKKNCEKTYLQKNADTSSR